MFLKAGCDFSQVVVDVDRLALNVDHYNFVAIYSETGGKFLHYHRDFEDFAGPYNLLVTTMGMNSEERHSGDRNLMDEWNVMSSSDVIFVDKGDCSEH